MRVQTGGSMAEDDNPQHCEHTKSNILGSTGNINGPEMANNALPTAQSTNLGLSVATGGVTIFDGGVTGGQIAPNDGSYPEIRS